MNNRSLLTGFINYLQLERGLSANTLHAYKHDVEMFFDFLEKQSDLEGIKSIDLKTLHDFVAFVVEMGLGAASQARVISGVKAFFRFLLMEEILDTDPSELLESPQMGKKLPEVLTLEEIIRILDQIDRSAPNGERNKAIVETLYGCGIRVSELIGLRISDIHFKEEFVIVTGKGNKQRLVPLGNIAAKQINYYLKGKRQYQKTNSKEQDILFLNNRGGPLSRQMIFLLIKSLAEKAGIRKTVSPHTFRHSYATHLVQNGANLRAVQELLGHASIITTEIYTHLNTNDLRNAILTFHPRNTKY